MELYRKISQKIENHLRSGNDKILVIDGARQIGKTHVIRRTAKSLFKNYIEINMEADKISQRAFRERPHRERLLSVTEFHCGRQNGEQKRHHSLY